MKKIIALTLSAVMVAAMAAGCKKTEETAATTSETTVAETPSAFEETYGNQLMNYLDHQYYFDGQPVPLTDSNYYFLMSFDQLNQYAQMGSFPVTTLGHIDLSAAFEYNTEDSDPQFATNGDLFIYQSETAIESACIYALRAEKEGVTLSEKGKEDLEALMESFKSEAATMNMTFEEYLELYFGPGSDEASVREMLGRFLLQIDYQDRYVEQYDKNVPYIRYALFEARETDSQEQKDLALEKATAMKDACSVIDDLTGLAEEAYAAGEVLDQGDIAVPKNRMVPKFEEWAYGEDRTEGELDIIYAPEYGYFVVGYIGLTEITADEIRNIALTELNMLILEEIEAGTHDFYTNDVFLPAPLPPTATPAPVFDPDAAVPAETQTSGSMSTADVLIVVFITLASVAVLAVIVILINYAVKNSKNNSKDRSKGKSEPKKSYSDVEEDDEDDEDDEEDEKPARKGKKKKNSAPKDESEEDDTDDDIWVPES